MNSTAGFHSLRETNIYPILIPTPFAVGDVYCYLIDNEKKVLVDCGHKSEGALSLIRQTFNEQGLAVGDLDEIWLTHGHPDHFGLAKTLAQESGAVIRGHEKERANFAGNDDRELFGAFFEERGIPSGQIKMMVGQLDWLQQFQDPVEPEWVEDGDSLTAGALACTVHHTPGHAPGHVVYRADSGILFGGDLLLHKVSTNALINFDPGTGKRNKSLLQYRQSLEWMQQQEGPVLPGHGEFIKEVEEVAGHHLGEHEKRYQKIKHLLSNRPMSLFGLAKAIFPEAIEQQATFLALSEVMGYLDWGIEKREIEEKTGDNGIKYSAGGF